MPNLFRKLVSWCGFIRGDVNTRGGEQSPGNSCATCAALTGFIGDRLLTYVEKGESWNQKEIRNKKSELRRGDKVIVLKGCLPNMMFRIIKWNLQLENHNVL